VRHHDAIGAFEDPAIPEVPVDAKSALVHQAAMARAKQYQVVETRLTTGRLVLHVMRIDETRVATAGKDTALVSSSTATHG